jgi:hypothetical protein
MGKKAAGLLGAIIAGALIGSFLGGDKYNIEGSKIKAGKPTFNSLVEYKGEDKIKYLIKIDSTLRVKVNGKKYNSKDTLIYEEAFRRYNYLNEKIDSINQARKESKLQKKIEEEQKKVNEVLEILRK